MNSTTAARCPMKAGDICVQRGTMHAWVAKGSEPAVFAFVLIDAELSRRAEIS